MTAIAESTLQNAIDQQERNRFLVRRWLYVVLLVLFALVVVGGATRLTESGLSITEWKPVMGVLPPLTEEAWEVELEKYRQIPEYQLINKGMSMDDFKTIYWWEWGHRLLARGVGLVFALPLAFFWLSGRLEGHLKPKLVALLALGGLQGAIGWWMVASGLVDRTDVSQYRLATHLTLACVIFAATMVVARGLAPHTAAPSKDGTRTFALVLMLLVLVQIYLGGLVAGLNAGLAYNTWPLMDGAIVPDGLFIQRPWWINFFENAKTVQFVHRVGGYVLFAAALWHMIQARREEPGTTHARRALVLLHLMLVQAAIGVTTLLLEVQIGWALLHQAFALVVLGFAAAHWRGTRGGYPAETGVLVRS